MNPCGIPVRRFGQLVFCDVQTRMACERCGRPTCSNHRGGRTLCSDPRGCDDVVLSRPCPELICKARCLVEAEAHITCAACGWSAPLRSAQTAVRHLPAR